MTPFPLQAEKEGGGVRGVCVLLTPPHLSRHPIRRFTAGAHCLRSKAPFVSRALIEFQPLRFYLEFSRQFHQNRFSWEQIQLLLISNRLSFRGGQFGEYATVCALGRRIGRSAGVEAGWWVVMTGCQLAVDLDKKGEKRYYFITKQGQRDEHRLWKWARLR